MYSRLRSTVRRFISRVLDLPASVGWIDKETGLKAFLISFPIMIIGGMRILMRIADYLMISYAYETDAAVAGVTIGFQYYFIGFGLALALSSGTLSVVARQLGAGNQDRANFSVKQSMYLTLFLSVPLTAAAWFYAEPLVDLLTDDPAVIELGAIYLSIVMVSITLRFWNLISARALAGAGNTQTPMWIRMVSVPANVIFNAFLIFGIGPFPAMGVAGAAWGTVLADLLAFSLFLTVFLSRTAEVQLELDGRQWDWSMVWELFRVGIPLGGMRLCQSLGRFPFTFIVAAVGTSLLASYGISRRVVLLAMMPAWGFATAASTLVGQNIGSEQPERASFSGWQTLRVGLATQLLVAFGITVLAGPITWAFQSQAPYHTKAFIQVFGVVVAAYSVSRTMQGALRGAGDTAWPFYGTFAGTVVRLMIASLALPSDLVIGHVAGYAISPGSGLGVEFIYLAIVADLYLRALINVGRFATGLWKGRAPEPPVTAEAAGKG
jgi:putative MATE family efflux protein